MSEKNKLKSIVKRTVIAASTIVVATSPLTAFAQSDEKAVVQEVGQSGKPFSIPGNAQTIDDISNDSSKQFITVKTKNNQTFFMVIDRAQSTENVYMLSLVDEDDLSEFSKAADTASNVVVPETLASNTAKDGTDSNAQTEEEESGNNSTVMIIAIVVVLGAVGGAGYYFKVYKPKKEAADDREEGIEENDYDEPYVDEEEINEDDEFEEDEEYEASDEEDSDYLEDDEIDQEYEEDEIEESDDSDEVEETEEPKETKQEVKKPYNNKKKRYYKKKNRNNSR